MRRPVTIGQASLDAHGLDGSVCLSCGDYDPHDTQCEPDAERYPCSQCDKRMRYGVEQAIVCGRVGVTS